MEKTNCHAEIYSQKVLTYNNRFMNEPRKYLTSLFRRRQDMMDESLETRHLGTAKSVDVHFSIAVGRLQSLERQINHLRPEWNLFQ